MGDILIDVALSCGIAAFAVAFALVITGGK